MSRGRFGEPTTHLPAAVQVNKVLNINSHPSGKLRGTHSTADLMKDEDG
jgi:hypothetical protein